jgi:hypothetical protein
VRDSSSKVQHCSLVWPLTLEKGTNEFTRENHFLFSELTVALDFPAQS